MIQAKDLRIGNRVLAFKGMEGEVEEIRSRTVFLKGANVGVKFDDLNPIPLTEERLVRAGFIPCQEIGMRKILKHNNSGNLKAEVCAYDECAFYLFDELIGFHKSFHQLQNLYHALTGQELTITEPVTA